MEQQEKSLLNYNSAAVQTSLTYVYKKIEDNKEKILEEVNKNRKNEDIDENYIKTLNKNNKLDPKVKETRKIKQIDRLKYKDNYKTYHKDQFIKKKKYCRNMGTDTHVLGSN